MATDVALREMSKQAENLEFFDIFRAPKCPVVACTAVRIDTPLVDSGSTGFQKIMTVKGLKREKNWTDGKTDAELMLA